VRANKAPLGGKENIRGRPDQQAFPITFAEWDRNSREIVRVALPAVADAMGKAPARAIDLGLVLEGGGQ
jgi:hypothetical protein